MTGVDSKYVGPKGEHLKGFRNAQTKNRNAARKQMRRDYPELKGRKLNRWPLDVFV